jgi:hypothetical protein
MACRETEPLESEVKQAQQLERPVQTPTNIWPRLSVQGQRQKRDSLQVVPVDPGDCLTKSVAPSATCEP